MPRRRNPKETDWAQIAALYLWLERLTPTAPVRLSRVRRRSARAYGPAPRGSALLDDLDEQHGLAARPVDQAADPRSARSPAGGDPATRPRPERLFKTAAALTDNAVERSYLNEQGRN
jgi:predicted RNA polymerase sigma factor